MKSVARRISRLDDRFAVGRRPGLRALREPARPIWRAQHPRNNRGNAMPTGPATADGIRRIEKLVNIYTEKSGTGTRPDRAITSAVVQGLARNLDLLERPLCPCRFYANPAEETRHRTWICPCDDMRIYKYCHCCLFVDPERNIYQGSRRPGGIRIRERSDTY
jgi:ferredoxin-thioredoxin reductase catalytic chain